MNKVELVAAVAEQAGLSKAQAQAAVKAFTDAVIAAVAAEDSVQLIGFGSFAAKKVAARTGRNPATKEVIKIAAKTVPVFKAGKAFKEVVNAPKKKSRCRKCAK